MSYPSATDEQVASFREHGYLVVVDAIPQDDLDELEAHTDTLIENKETLAFDWAWDENEDKDKRSFRIVQSSPSFVWKEIVDARFRKWAVEFGSSLLGALTALLQQLLPCALHDDPALVDGLAGQAADLLLRRLGDLTGLLGGTVLHRGRAFRALQPVL